MVDKEQWEPAASSSTQPLLRSASGSQMTGTAMSDQQTPVAPARPRSATTLRMTAEQTRKLAALKAQRAARISQAQAASQRRLVTVSVTALLLLLTAVLGALSVVSWWWSLPSSILLVASLAGSRIAAINIEKSREREEQQFQTLREQVDARGGTRYAVAGVTHIEAIPAAVAAKSSPAEAVPAIKELETAEPAGVAVEEVQEKEAATWDVPQMPVASVRRKSKLPRRQVHADTDIRGVPQVIQAVGRPLAATGTGDSFPVENQEYSMDLDAVLESRRAQ